MDVTAAIKRLRQSMKMSQQAFANALELSIGAVTNYERGRAPEPKSLARLYKVALDSHQPKLAAVFQNELVKQMGLAGRMTALGALAYVKIPQIHADLALMLNDFKNGGDAPDVKIANAIQRLERTLPEMDELNFFLAKSAEVQVAREDE